MEQVQRYQPVVARWKQIGVLQQQRQRAATTHAGERVYERRKRARVSLREKESGMTIHFVNENYDEGAIAFQAGINISELNSAEEIASSVLKLEHEYYPKIARELILEYQRKLE